MTHQTEIAVLQFNLNETKKLFQNLGCRCLITNDLTQVFFKVLTIVYTH